MRAQSYRTARHHQIPTASSSLPVHSAVTYGGGLISEIDYSADHPMTTLLLLPLLQQLGLQSRWLLWLAPQQKLSRHWLQQSGLPVEKIIQSRHLNPTDTVDSMERALATGNYSVVLCWLPHDLTEDGWGRLRQAAQKGNTYGLIMRPQRDESESGRPLSRLKIHSASYH